MSVSSRRRVAVAAAVAATVWAAVVTLVGAAVTPGYSHVAHYISELGANGAPAGLWVSRAGFLPIGVTAFAALIASGGGRPVLRAARFCLMALPLAYLVAAFARNARARAFFETLDGTNRYAILYRVQTAKKPETRAERIKRFVALCARHETIHPRRQAKSGTRSRGTSKKARAKE